jgi:hypothetical protein
MLAQLWQHVDEAGRDRTALDVAFTTGLAGPADEDFSADAQLETLDRMAGLGVTWNSVTVPGDSLAGAVEAVERYGAEVISRS